MISCILWCSCICTQDFVPFRSCTSCLEWSSSSSLCFLILFYRCLKKYWAHTLILSINILAFLLGYSMHVKINIKLHLSYVIMSHDTLFCQMVPSMFPLSCACARAHTAFQPSAHSIFSVPTNLKSFHYYFEVIFCPLFQLFSLRSRKTAVSSYIRHPCIKVVDYTEWTKV